ncbi:MAG: hypothetical protein RLZZ316_499, partial [Bacteroidota bacterium]
SERGKKLAKGYTWTDWRDTAYAQDVLPVKEQKEITGHAVRAMYMYTGAADVAAQTGDEGYIKAMKTVWEDVVYRNMYITGGIGSAGSNEGFSVDYDLPNEQAYCETCASVGMVFWNHRMNLLTGEAKYIDVLEKSLYNGALDGLSLTGDRFFYGNPLASRGQHQRREWFGTACCPANIARLVASLGDYIYAKSSNAVYINLFVASETAVMLNKIQVGLKMETNYPWSSGVSVKIDLAKPAVFELKIRKPNWVDASENSLYKTIAMADSTIMYYVNGQPVPVSVADGYISINRKWKKGDVVSFAYTLQPLLVQAKKEIKQNDSRVAIQYGPLVYCVEGADNNGKAWNIVLPANTPFEIIDYKVQDETVIAITATVPVVSVAADGLSLNTTTKKIIAIPYYTWANRGKNEMQVWLPTTIKDIKLNY